MSDHTDSQEIPDWFQEVIDAAREGIETSGPLDIATVQEDGIWNAVIGPAYFTIKGEKEDDPTYFSFSFTPSFISEKSSEEPHILCDEQTVGVDGVVGDNEYTVTVYFSPFEQDEPSKPVAEYDPSTGSFTYFEPEADDDVPSPRAE